MIAVLVVVLCGIVCYLLRIGPVALLGRAEPPAWLDRVATLSAPVAFTALAVTALAGAAQGGAGALLPRLAAVAVAAAVAAWTRSVGATMGAGMLTFWLAAAVSAA